MKTSNTTLIRAIETEVYSRVVGYYRPLQNWNDGKRLEFSKRHLMEGNDKRISSGEFMKLVG
ncbi:MAG: hypothetical protein JXR95_01715 [Deltaproteobacteria bacterium]|nr:hypothetical protein [Deltaproteobacteria bacterium]